MGKESKLRKPAEEQEYFSETNGRRQKFNAGRTTYDPERCPDGCNTDVWHLALYFRDIAASCGIVVTYGPTVAYGFLQKALTKLQPSAILARARTTGIQVQWVAIVEKAIEEYFEYDSDIDVSSFSYKLEFYIQRAIDTISHEELVKTAKRVPQQDTELQPSKRTAEQQARHEILNREYTEQERLEKMKDFRSRNK